MQKYQPIVVLPKLKPVAELLADFRLEDFQEVQHKISAYTVAHPKGKNRYWAGIFNYVPTGCCAHMAVSNFFSETSLSTCMPKLYEKHGSRKLMKMILLDVLTRSVVESMFHAWLVKSQLDEGWGEAFEWAGIMQILPPYPNKGYGNIIYSFGGVVQ